MIISYQDLDSMHKSLDIECLRKKKAELEVDFHRHKESVRIAILDWIDKDVKEIINRTVINEHHNTVNLGETKLSELKAKSKEIPDKARSMIGEFLSNDLIWKFKENKGIIFSGLSSRPTEALDGIIRSAKGLAGALLMEYNYSQDNWKGSHGSVSFKYGYDWDKSINNKMDELHTILWKLNDINKRIEDTISNDKKAKANDLWDKA